VIGATKKHSGARRPEKLAARPARGIVSSSLAALSVGALAAMGEGQKPNAAAVKREAEEDWGR